MKKVAEVLEGLREEERRLTVELSGVRRAIAALEEVMGISPQARSAEAPIAEAPIADAPEPVPGPYASASFYEAAAAYLSAAGEPRTNREIAQALLAGGYPTRARNFTATVRTMLHRKFSAEPYGISPDENSGRWLVRT